MDASTGLMLALQLVALCSIAGALLLYLLCKVRAGGSARGPQPGQTKSVLVTSADTALGLQVIFFILIIQIIQLIGTKNTGTKINLISRMRHLLKALTILFSIPLDGANVFLFVSIGDGIVMAHPKISDNFFFL